MAKKQAIKDSKKSRYRKGLTPANILLDVETRKKIDDLSKVMREKLAAAMRDKDTEFGSVNISRTAVIRAAVDELHAKLMPKGKRSA